MDRYDVSLQTNCIEKVLKPEHVDSIIDFDMITGVQKYYKEAYEK